MSYQFPAGTSGNPAGRPAGVRAIRRTRLISAFNRTVEPHAEELMQRAVSQALSGDGQALAALLALVGQAMAGSTSTGTAPGFPLSEG